MEQSRRLSNMELIETLANIHDKVPDIGRICMLFILIQCCIVFAVLYDRRNR
jgi:hypothetical protein